MQNTNNVREEVREIIADLKVVTPVGKYKEALEMSVKVLMMDKGLDPEVKEIALSEYIQEMADNIPSIA